MSGGLGLTLRGLWERRGLSLVVFLVAAVSVATAAAGPIFADSARTILARTTLEAASPDTRAWRLTTREEDGLAARTAKLTAGLPFLDPPIPGAELVSPEVTTRRNYPLMWQDGQCEHLALAEGRCPRTAKEIMVSAASGFPLDSTVRVSGVSDPPGADGEQRLAELRVVGVYRPGDIDDPFWFGRNLFAQSAGATETNGDPFFTVPATRAHTVATGTAAWTESAIVFLDPRRVTGADIGRVEEAQRRADEIAAGGSVLVFTGVPRLLEELRAQTGTLGVPALVVIAQLVALGWLLLFLTVSDLVAARAPEIALARVRGHGRARVWRFGMAEPLVLLAAALPAGLALAAGPAGSVLAGLLPAQGASPVVVTAGAVAAGAAVPLGGLAAAAIAAWRMARRPVVEEWRGAPRRRARGWIVDAVVLALTALGLAELLATGGVIAEGSGQRAGALAVPGLVALAAALLACRALPLLARTLFARTRRSGGLGPFLALRQIARGSATAGSVIVLGTAFGLATFGTAAWSVTSANYERVARTHNGADTVLRVGAMPLEEFREAVERADPSGSRAAPVLSVPGGQAAMLATDPARFARVAYWRPSFAGDQAGVPLSTLAGRLGREMAPRVLVTGDRFRVRIGSVRPPENWQPRLHADFRVPGHPRPVSIPLGLLDPARTVLEWGLPKDCRTAVCELRAIRGEVDFSPGATAAPDSRLDVPVRELAVRRDGRWRELDAGLTDPGRWRGPAEAGPKGLTLPMTPFGAVSAIPETFPEELPALVNGQLDGRYSQGADQAYLVKYDAVSTGPALPGLDRPGAIVDLELADRAAYAVDPKAEFQVWVAAGHGEAVRAALTRQGVPVFEPTRYTDLVARYTLQGPGLALFLLLLAAPAAAVLALGRAVLALYAAARRRSYELAALEAAGARPRALRAALLLEQLITLAAGMLAGVAAGLAAAAAALPRIPQFTATPLTPPLLYDPAPLPLVAVAVLALLAALAAAALTAELLLRRVRVDRLRESPA